MVASNESDMAQRIPDIMNGTACGRISDPTSTLVGRRVVHEEHFGTICYVGPLPNSSGVWLGVDWDNPDRGRHDGSYKGHRYFQSKTSTSGSFVRPDKVSLGTSLEEALVFRYTLCPMCQLSSDQPQQQSTAQGPQPTFVFQPTGVPGHVSTLLDSSSPQEDLEFHGQSDSPAQPIRIELFVRSPNYPDQSPFEPTQRHMHCGPQGAQLTLKDLRSATFIRVPIYRSLLGPPVNETAYLWPLTGGTLGQLLPNLRELDLNECLLSRWVEVAEICVQLPQLKSLDLSNNRLRLLPCANHAINDLSEQEARLLFDLDSDSAVSEQLFSRAFTPLQRLVLVRCTLLDWSGLERILAWTCSLRILSLAFIQLGNIPETLPDRTTRVFRNLTDLDLTLTGLTDLTQLFALIGPSTVLENLWLNQNPIRDIPRLPVAPEKESNPFAASSWFTNLTTLGLRRTGISEWHILAPLLRMPKLKHLILTDCPVTDSVSPQTARQELIARFPRLAVLNQMEILADERRGAELDYLKRYGGLWRSMGGVALDRVDSSTLPRKECGSAVRMPEAFAQQHPVFDLLCSLHGPPEDGETKLITRSLKEGLTSLEFVLQLPSALSTRPDSSLSTAPLVRRIPARMTVNHLRTLIRRMFKLPPNITFDLVVQSERHRKMQLAELQLDADTRELGFYCLEDGDTIVVRIHD